MNIQNKNKKKKGFTLVELVVVVAILAVLAVTAVMSVGNISSQASDAAAIADANAIIRALNTYNAMAGTPIESDLTVAKLQGLNLSTAKTPPDLIDMALGVDVDSTRLSALISAAGYKIRSGADKDKALKVAYASNMWTKTIG